MSRISIVDLEVFYCVGVSDEERAQPQRLLLTVDMNYDFSSAALCDRITETIDYFAVSQRLLQFGEGRSYQLLERVVWNIAEMVMDEFNPQSVTVEAKKFVIPQARFVSVSVMRNRLR
jgi:dihydroneopterin aldolase